MPKKEYYKQQFGLNKLLEPSPKQRREKLTNQNSIFMPQNGV